MPKKDNLLRAISRKRQKAMCLQIPAPTDRHFDVPDEFAPFLQQVSGKDDKERILIFGDVTMKNLLNLSNTWLVDGTLKLSPEIFYQILSKKRLQAYFRGSTPNIWLLLRNLEKDSKMQKFKYVQETAGLLCSKRPRYEKIKKQMQNIRSTYEFENAVPYLRAVAKFRLKTFRHFQCFFFFFFCKYSFLSSE